MAWENKQDGDLITAEDINYIGTKADALGAKETTWDGATTNVNTAKTDYKGVTHDTLNERLIQDNTDLRDDLNPNRMNIEYSGTSIYAQDSLTGYTEDLTASGFSIAYSAYSEDVAIAGTLIFTSVLDNKYYDLQHGTILNGTGNDITITNDSDAIADLAYINMTSFGIEDYTEEQMLNIVHGMQAGTDIQSAILSEVKSTGKNLFDWQDFYSYLQSISNAQSSISIKEGRKCIGISTGLSGSVEYMKGRFKANTQYTFQGAAKWDTRQTAVLKIYYTDGSDDNMVAAFNANFTNQTIVSDANKTIDFIGISYWYAGWGFFDVNTLQFEQGSTPTPYAEYVSDTITINPPKILPQGETWTAPRQLMTYPEATHITNDSGIPSNMSAKIPTNVPALLSRKETEINALTTLTTEQKASVANLQTINDELVQQQADTQEAVDNIIPLVL